MQIQGVDLLSSPPGLNILEHEGCGLGYPVDPDVQSSFLVATVLSLSKGLDFAHETIQLFAFRARKASDADVKKLERICCW